MNSAAATTAGLRFVQIDTATARELVSRGVSEGAVRLFAHLHVHAKQTGESRASHSLPCGGGARNRPPPPAPSGANGHRTPSHLHGALDAVEPRKPPREHTTKNYFGHGRQGFARAA